MPIFFTETSSAATILFRSLHRACKNFAQNHLEVRSIGLDYFSSSDDEPMKYPERHVFGIMRHFKLVFHSDRWKQFELIKDNFLMAIKMQLKQDELLFTHDKISKFDDLMAMINELDLYKDQIRLYLNPPLSSRPFARRHINHGRSYSQTHNTSTVFVKPNPPKATAYTSSSGEIPVTQNESSSAGGMPLYHARTPSRIYHLPTQRRMEDNPQADETEQASCSCKKCGSAICCCIKGFVWVCNQISEAKRA